MKYLFRCVMTGRDFDVLELQKNLPEKSSMYSGIWAFALSVGAKKIDADIIYRFFGGAVHIDFVFDQINAVGKKGKFADGYVFAHILKPVILTAVSGENVSAKYVNKNVAVDISNLLIHPCIHVKFKAGDMVLVHYAVIVGVACEDICEYLFGEQESSQEFTSVCQRISEIDYGSFWDLKNWTQNLIGRCF
ncbi:MAG TPA: hypothetical protein P5262_00855 [Candidatus Moranbacteria bacterium]|nr:hypothetical protein [Candidatus Moranbacteria bacterium]